MERKKSNASIISHGKYNDESEHALTNDQILKKITYSNLGNIYSLNEKFEFSRITSLNLSNCNLTDTKAIPKELPLKDLNLSNNKLTAVPEALYHGLDQIEKLNLASNKIETFEFEPNCCQSLQILILCSNELKNIPQWILNLRATYLKELCYDFNKVRCLKCIFDNSRDFSIQKLSMVNCILRIDDIKYLREYSNLEELDISNSTEAAAFINVLPNIEELFIQPNWKNMRILKLNNLSISIFPESITWIESITELHMSNNDFMWLPTDGLEYLVNLEVLDLSHNHLSSIPEKLTWLEHVKVLRFNYNKIETIPDFSKMKNLETLDLYNNHLIEFVYNMLITKLKCLDLEFNLIETEKLQENYVEMRKNLRQNICENRLNGVKIVNSIDEWSESSITSDEDEEIIQDRESFISVLTEDWDEEIRMSERNQDITPSDDEWPGFEEDVVRFVNKPIETVIFSCNEDVIFCDAD